MADAPDTALLREIRDAQEALLAEYRAASARAVALQEEGVERQRQLGVLYRRVVAVSAVVGVGLVGLVVYVLVRLLAMLG